MFKHLIKFLFIKNNLTYPNITSPNYKKNLSRPRRLYCSADNGKRELSDRPSIECHRHKAATTATRITVIPVPWLIMVIPHNSSRGEKTDVPGRITMS